MLRLGEAMGPGGGPSLLALPQLPPVVGFAVTVCFACIATIITDTCRPHSTMRVLAGTGSLAGSVASLLWLGGVGKVVHSSWHKYVLLQVSTFCACAAGGWAGSTSPGNNMLPLAYATAFWLMCPIQAGREAMVLLVQLAETAVSVVLHMHGQHSQQQVLAPVMLLYALIGMVAPVAVMTGLIAGAQDHGTTCHAAGVPNTHAAGMASADQHSSTSLQAATQTEYDSMLLELLNYLHFASDQDQGSGRLAASVLSEAVAAKLGHGSTATKSAAIATQCSGPSSSNTGSSNTFVAEQGQHSRPGKGDSCTSMTSHTSGAFGQAPSSTNPPHTPQYALTATKSLPSEWSPLPPMPTRQLSDRLAQRAADVRFDRTAAAAVAAAGEGVASIITVPAPRTVGKALRRSRTFSHASNLTASELAPISETQEMAFAGVKDSFQQLSHGASGSQVGCGGSTEHAASGTGLCTMPHATVCAEDGTGVEDAASAAAVPPVAGRSSAAQAHLRHLGVRRTRSLTSLQRAATGSRVEPCPGPQQGASTAGLLQTTVCKTAAAALRGLAPTQATAPAATAQQPAAPSLQLLMSRVAPSTGASGTSTPRSASGGSEVESLASGLQATLVASSGGAGSPVTNWSAPQSSVRVPLQHAVSVASSTGPGPQVRVRLVLDYEGPAGSCAVGALPAGVLSTTAALTTASAPVASHRGGSVPGDCVQHEPERSGSGSSGTVGTGPPVCSCPMVAAIAHDSTSLAVSKEGAGGGLQADKGEGCGHESGGEGGAGSQLSAACVALAAGSALYSTPQQQPGPSHARSRSCTQDGSTTAGGHLSGAGLHGGATVLEHRDTDLQQPELYAAGMRHGEDGADAAGAVGRRLVMDAGRVMLALQALVSAGGSGGGATAATASAAANVMRAHESMIQAGGSGSSGDVGVPDAHPSSHEAASKAAAGDAPAVVASSAGGASASPGCSAPGLGPTSPASLHHQLVTQVLPRGPVSMDAQVLPLSGLQLGDARGSSALGGRGSACGEEDLPPAQAIASLVVHVAAAEAGDAAACAALEGVPAEAVAAARELLAAAHEVQGREGGWEPPTSPAHEANGASGGLGLQHLPPVLLAALQSSTSNGVFFDSISHRSTNSQQGGSANMATIASAASTAANTVHTCGTAQASITPDTVLPAPAPSEAETSPSRAPDVPTAVTTLFAQDAQHELPPPDLSRSPSKRHLIKPAGFGAFLGPAAAAAVRLMPPPRLAALAPSGAPDNNSHDTTGHGSAATSTDTSTAWVYQRAQTSSSATQVGTPPTQPLARARRSSLALDSSDMVHWRAGNSRADRLPPSLLRLLGSVAGASPGLLHAYASEAGFGSLLDSNGASSSSQRDLSAAQSMLRLGTGSVSFGRLLSASRRSASWGEMSTSALGLAPARGSVALGDGRGSSGSFYGWTSLKGQAGLHSVARGTLTRPSCQPHSASTGSGADAMSHPSFSAGGLLDEDEEILQVAGALALDLSHPDMQVAAGRGLSEPGQTAGESAGGASYSSDWSSEDKRHAPLHPLRVRRELEDDIGCPLHDALASGQHAQRAPAVGGSSTTGCEMPNCDSTAGAAAAAIRARSRSTVPPRDSSFRFFAPPSSTAAAATQPPSQEVGASHGLAGATSSACTSVDAAAGPLLLGAAGSTSGQQLLRRTASSQLSSPSTGPVSEDGSPQPMCAKSVKLITNLLALQRSSQEAEVQYPSAPHTGGGTGNMVLGEGSAHGPGGMQTGARVGAGGSSRLSASTASAAASITQQAGLHGLPHSAHSSATDDGASGPHASSHASSEHANLRALPGLLPPVIPEQREKDRDKDKEQQGRCSSKSQVHFDGTGGTPAGSTGSTLANTAHLSSASYFHELMVSRFSGASAASSQGRSSSTLSRVPPPGLFAVNGMGGMTAGTSGSGLEEEQSPHPGLQMFQGRSLQHNSSMEKRLALMLASANLSQNSHTSAELTTASTLAPALSRSPSIAHRGGAVSRMFTRAPSLARSNRGSEAAPGHAQLIAGALRTSVGSGSGELLEVALEDTLVAHRRLVDASRVLLEEVHVDKVLGFGSMGVVYFGMLWGVRVVVKMIEHGAGVLGKAQHRGRLARTEAIVSRTLCHPNIVLTYDACTGPLDASRLKVSPALPRGGVPRRGPAARGRQRQMTVMVQELCELGTLRDALKGHKFGLEPGSPDHPRLVVQLGLDVAQGLRYMHGLRVLHVDLKAENVLLCRPPAAAALQVAGRVAGLAAKVADFGLAQVLPVDSDVLHSGIHGTVSHMPPEAMRDVRFSFATDVYSFGMVLWELVTCEKPYPRMPAYAVVEAVCERGERPAWPENLCPVLQGVRGLGEACWDDEPDRRPSFKEIVDRLQPLMAQASGHASVSRNESAHSMVSDESDELEAALREQELRALTATRASTSPTANARARRASMYMAGTNTDLLLGTAGRDQLAAAKGTSDALLGSVMEAAAVAREPPRDMLGRMLHFLTQAAPPTEQLVQVALPNNLGVRFCVAVDMSG